MHQPAIVVRADARSMPLADASVDLIVTSPPYYLLRDYGCDGQIGNEQTPAEYIDTLLDCTREWARVLKPTGSLFINLGDKYANDSKWGGASGRRHLADEPRTGYRSRRMTGMPAKSLMGLPWRYALGCVDQLGLILRAEIIWSKPNCMPESVNDRVWRSHEQWFHLTRQPRYYSAVDAIRQPHAGDTGRPSKGGGHPFKARDRSLPRAGRGRYEGPSPLGKVPGSVWDIVSEPLRVPDRLGVEHDAPFPIEWPRRLILGWSPAGICVECGEGWRPVAEAVRTVDGQPRDDLRGWASPDGPRRTPNGIGHRRFGTHRRIVGYACACPECPACRNCREVAPGKPCRECPPTRPAVVLDPFGGSGTTALVASALGRLGVTADSSADYCRLAAWRTADRDELARVLRVAKPPGQIDGQLALFEVEGAV